MTRKMFSRSAAVAALAAGALILSACGGGDDAALPDTGWVPGPLDEFQARIWGWNLDATAETADEATARWEAEQRQIDALVMECMAEHGFEWLPNESSRSFVAWNEDEFSDIPEWGSLEFAETYGFGMYNNPWNRAGDGEDVDGMMPEVEEWFDPNEDMLNAMSESERAAWEEALWGPPWDGTGEWEWDPTAGCMNIAQNEIWNWTTPDEFAGLQAEMDLIWDEIERHPRITEVNAEWASCMVDRGYGGWASQTELSNQLWEEWDTLNGWGPDNNDIWMNHDWEAFPDGPVIRTATDEEMAAFGAREIELAVANWHCRQVANPDTAWTEVHHEIQQAFVDRHGDELEAWAQMEEARRAAREN